MCDKKTRNDTYHIQALRIPPRALPLRGSVGGTSVGLQFLQLSRHASGGRDAIPCFLQVLILSCAHLELLSAIGREEALSTTVDVAFLCRHQSLTTSSGLFPRVVDAYRAGFGLSQ